MTTRPQTAEGVNGSRHEAWADRSEWKQTAESDPDHPEDPKVFHVVFGNYGTTPRPVFTDETPPHLLLDVMSFEKRPDIRNPRRVLTGLAVASAVFAGMHHRRVR